jgi:hypothetical protein
VVLVRVERDGKHHQDRYDTTRQDAGDEQLTHRHIRHHSVDHERQRRRDDRTQRRRRRRHANREAEVVALILHRLDLDRPESCRVGDRRTRHAGEDDRADDVHMPEATLEPPDQRQCVVDAVGDAGVIHQVAGHDENGTASNGKSSMPLTMRE